MMQVNTQQEDFDQYYPKIMQRYQISRSRVNNASFTLVALGLLTAAMLGAVTFSALFGASIALTITVFIAGLVVDGQIYFNKFPKLLRIIFLRDLLLDLDANEALRNLISNDVNNLFFPPETDTTDPYQITHLKEHFCKDHLDQWLYLYRALKNKGIDFLEIKGKDEHEKRFIAFCEEFENTKKAAKARSLFIYGFKRFLIFLGIPLSMAIALGMGAIAYGKWFELLLLLGVSTAPLPLIILGIVVSVIAGSLWGLAMYKTYYSAVRGNIFKKIRDKFSLDQAFWERYQSKTNSQKIFTMLGIATKYLIMIALSILGTMAVIASCGAYGSAMLSVFSFLPTAVIFALGIAILPVRALFMIKHAVGAVAKLFKLSDQGFRLKEAKQWFKNEFVASPIKCSIQLILGTVLFTLTALHVLAESALEMGGDSDNVFWERLFSNFHWACQIVGKFLDGISRLVHLSIQQFMACSESIIEFLEHFDFTFKQTPVVMSGAGDAYASLLSRLGGRTPEELEPDQNQNQTRTKPEPEPQSQEEEDQEFYTPPTSRSSSPTPTPTT